MVNMNSMTEELKKELAFTEEDLKELEQARKCLSHSMKTVLKSVLKIRYPEYCGAA